VPKLNRDDDIETAEGALPGQALRDSEARYRRLFETAQDGVLILDAKTGSITDVNPFLIKLLDYSREELLGKSLWDMSPPRRLFES
jgi:PAS domain S-box-containing protein